MSCWRRLLTQIRYSIHHAPTQVERRQSEFGKVKHLFTRSYVSPNKYQNKLQGISKSAREQESSIVGLNAALRNAGKPTKDGLFGTESALIRMLAASKANFKQSPWHDAATFLFSWSSRVLCVYFVYKGWSHILEIDEEVLPSVETSTKLSDVIGVDEAKAELEEIVHYLKDPEHFTRLGGKFPKSILLVGPPGNGKKKLAKAIAGEAGVPFFASSGIKLECNGIIGAKRVRDLFAAAKKMSPCIIFIDEIDAIGGSDDMYIFRMPLNQMLVELDGLKQKEGIIVIAATDCRAPLDKAFVKPGQFDRHVVVSNPDVEGRRQILEYHLSEFRKEEDVDVMIIARCTRGLSGADLAKLVVVAALRAEMHGAKPVSMHDLKFARDAIIMGL